MAAFLRADMLKYQSDFTGAINGYQASIELNKGKADRLERTYRPLIRCILASRLPDYSMAESYALESLRLRKTIFGLMGLARVYLHWKYLGVEYGRSVPNNIEKLFSDARIDFRCRGGRLMTSRGVSPVITLTKSAATSSMCQFR